MSAPLDHIDRAIIHATQEGLPLVPRPYDHVGAEIGVAGDEVRARLENMLASGVIRRVGAVLNHYALGFIANGMTVWDVDDAWVLALGRQVGALDFVSHAYLRPRHMPKWPYNLFAMTHGKDKAEVEAKVTVIRDLLGGACRGGQVLYSTRILKKTGLRLTA